MTSLFKTWKTLREKGIMGINERNSDYVLRYNARHLYPFMIVVFNKQF